MNTLLSFTPTLSQPELLAAVKEVGKLAEYDGPAAMEHIRALVRRYPTDTQLRFRLASIAMGFPQLYGWPDEAGEAAGDFAEQAFEYVCQHGKKKLWPSATFLLAGLLLNRDKLEQAEALADTLPAEHPVGGPRHGSRQFGRSTGKAPSRSSGTERRNRTGSPPVGCRLPARRSLLPHFGPDAAKRFADRPQISTAQNDPAFGEILCQLDPKS